MARIKKEEEKQEEAPKEEKVIDGKCDWCSSPQKVKPTFCSDFCKEQWKARH